MTHRVLVSSVLIVSILCLRAHAIHRDYNSTEGLAKISENLNRTLLVILDDSEYCSNRLSAAGLDVLSVLLEEASPVLVSASLISNIQNWKQISAKDPAILLRRLNDIRAIPYSERSGSQYTEMKNIILSVFHASEKVFSKWIIKKVNNFLCLLVPKKYLSSLNIDEKEFEQFVSGNTLTPVEQRLGLKINHMATITSTPSSSYEYCKETEQSYFMESIFNDVLQRSDIFVTNTEYYAYKNKKIPSWSIYIAGHGSMYSTVVNLSFENFRKFLAFLDAKLHTKLLYYVTCYGSGINSELLYKDITSTIQRSYPFVIISQGLSDSHVYSFSNTQVEMQHEELKIVTSMFFDSFVKEVTQENPNYKNILRDKTKQILKEYIAETTPQIKYPGLPWFALLDDTHVVIIGSILSKHRKEPLDIGTFFARKYEQGREIYGILMYANNVAFDLIINSKNSTGNPPKIISMIYGDQMHHIRSVSSQVYSTEKLIESFLKTPGTQKTFIIDIIQGTNGTLRDVIILLTSAGSTVYWRREESNVFKTINNKRTFATIGDIYKYKKLLCFTKPCSNISSLEVWNIFFKSLWKNINAWWVY